MLHLCIVQSKYPLQDCSTILAYGGRIEMPAYRYEGLTRQGESEQGTINAASESEAQREVRSRGIFITRLVKVSEAVASETAAEHEERSDLSSAQMSDALRSPAKPDSPRRTGCFPVVLLLISGAIAFMALPRPPSPETSGMMPKFMRTTVPSFRATARSPFPYAGRDG